MQNRVYVICIYNTRAGNFFLLKTRLLNLSSEVRRKPLFFKTQKVDSTGYYGIEDPFPNVISKLRRFRGDTECRLFVVKSHW